MPLRFFRRIRIAPGVSVNLSKSGASFSVGPRGAKVTVGPKGIRRTVGIPGTGVYYTTSTPLRSRTPRAGLPTEGPAIAGASPAPASAGFWARRSRKAKAAIIIGLLLVIWALTPHGATPTAYGGSTTAMFAPGRTGHAVDARESATLGAEVRPA